MVRLSPSMRTLKNRRSLRYYKRLFQGEINSFALKQSLLFIADGSRIIKDFANK